MEKNKIRLALFDELADKADQNLPLTFGSFQSLPLEYVKSLYEWIKQATLKLPKVLMTREQCPVKDTAHYGGQRTSDYKHKISNYLEQFGIPSLREHCMCVSPSFLEALANLADERYHESKKSARKSGGNC